MLESSKPEQIHRAVTALQEKLPNGEYIVIYVLDIQAHVRQKNNPKNYRNYRITHLTWKKKSPPPLLPSKKKIHQST